MDTEILDKSLRGLTDFDFLILFYGFIAILLAMVWGIQGFEERRTRAKLKKFFPTGPHLKIRVLRSRWILAWAGALLSGGSVLLWIGVHDLHEKINFYQQAVLVREAPISVRSEIRGEGKGRHRVFIGRFLIKFRGEKYLTIRETNQRLRKGIAVQFLWSPVQPERSLHFSVWSLFRFSATSLPIGFGLLLWGFGFLLKWKCDNEIRRSWKKMEVEVRQFDYRPVRGGFLLNALFEFSHPRGGSLSAGLFAVVVGERREDLSQLEVRWGSANNQLVAIESHPNLFGRFQKDRQKS